MDVAQFRKQLLEERQRVLDRIGWVEEAQRDIGRTVTPDELNEVEDYSVAALEQDVMLSLDEQSRREILDIHAALDRIRRGEYGVCERCGEEIPEARLRAMPTATMHVHCAEQVERDRLLRGAEADVSLEDEEQRRPRSGS
jgi:DnaK suppressor protein